MKMKTIKMPDVSPTSFSISSNERKAVEDFTKVSQILTPSQDMTPWVNGCGMEENLQGICNEI